MSKLLSISASMIFVALFSACSTINGVGQDVSKGGHAISRAAS